MPRVYVRKTERKGWSEEDCLLAIKELNDGAGLRATASKYKIPPRSLKRRMQKGPPSTPACSKKPRLGSAPILGLEGEQKLTKHIVKLQQSGFAPTKKEVQEMAFQLAECMNIKHNFNVEKQRAGRDWLDSFLERNKSISIRKAEGVSINRALGMNQKEVGEYFELLDKMMTEMNLHDKPSNIFSMDESGIQLNNKPGSDAVLAIKNSVVQKVTSGEKGETISVVVCVSAEGNFLPPYCIFKGKKMNNAYMLNMPPGSKIFMSQKSAYVNSEIFHDWFKNHFLMRRPPGKTLLILDGHSSHMNVQTLQLASENEVEFLCLPSHCTHYLQPLDRTFFKPLKTFYYQECAKEVKRSPDHRVTRFTFGRVLFESWKCAAQVKTGISGFSSTGIYPFNPNAVPDYAFIATVPHDPEPAIISEPEDDESLLPLPTISTINSEMIPPDTPSTNSESIPPTTSTINPEPFTLATFPATNSELITPAFPATNSEEMPEDNTPTKLLNKISPVPEIKEKKKSTRGRPKQSALNTTNKDFIESSIMLSFFIFRLSL